MLETNPIVQAVSQWFRRHFSDPEALGLFFTLVILFITIGFFGEVLKPILASIVLAYLLSSPVQWLERLKLPRGLAVLIVYTLFLGALIFSIVGLLPMLWKQLANLVHELPQLFSQAQSWVSELTQRYPKILSTDPVNNAIAAFHQQTTKIGRGVLSFSLSSISGAIEWILYLVLVPLLVFFFLKDGEEISEWLSRFLPRSRGLLRTVWSEVNAKIGAYVRGRIWEMLIVAGVTTAVFALLDLQYAVLLGALVGVSVIVPYIGAIIVTIPIVILALLQWGLTAHFAYLVAAYALIIVLDANLLVPLLFSEAMDLHPIVIILSVIIFGGLWGFWGVFFAIPLATLVKAILYAWPNKSTPV